MEKKDAGNMNSAITLNIRGMHCESCVGRVETALLRLAGVTRAEVDLIHQQAKISFNSKRVGLNEFIASIEAEGYHIVDENETGPEFMAECCNGSSFSWFSNRRSYLYGALASIAIVGVYLGMNTLTADWYFARVQFSEYRWWILTLAIGLGVQVTLFTLFRAYFRGKNRAAYSSMAASGGMSATAMIACCSHYLATVIPALGVPFLSAAAVARIAEYQIYFFLAGVLSCLVGIGLMLRMMKRHGMIQFGNLKNYLSLKPDRVSG